MKWKGDEGNQSGSHREMLGDTRRCQETPGLAGVETKLGQA
jgi:hypothetical protein